MSGPISIFAPSVRHPVAQLAAKYFLVHLQAELKKTDAILTEDYPDWPVRQMLHDLIEQMHREFSIAKDERLPEENLFETWCDLNGKFAYSEGGFIGYNLVYVSRLVDLRDGTAESLENHHDNMRKQFGRFDYERHGFTVAFFLESEGNMRELLRQAVRRHLPEIAEEGDRLVMVQSRVYQLAMYAYFEGILKKTLADNVRLLHGILPEPIASELKRNGHVEPVHFPEAAVIFTDFEKFSQSTALMTPREVIRRLDAYFSEFDRISAVYGLEKIKTIGDSYMAVAGVPQPHDDPVRAVCDAALEIRDASNRISEAAGAEGWNIRIGLHMGPLIAGVIGKQKFSYDVWGATVNLASRMESSGAPGRINASAEIYARAEPFYRWQPRGAQPVKRLAAAEMFFLDGKR